MKCLARLVVRNFTMKYKIPRPKLIIIGAGGHAKVAIDTILDADQYEIAGLIDRDVSQRSIRDIPVIGSDEELGRLRKEGIEFAFSAIGDNYVRVKLGNLAVSKGFKLANAVSPNAYVSRSAWVGNGILIATGAVINADVKVNDLVIINTSASVDHDCRIGEGAHIAPGVALAGHVTIGRGAFIGIGASIVPKIAIGDAATVGAGACVIADVPSGRTVYGVPARPAAPKED